MSEADLTHPRLEPRRGSRRLSWWARGWLSGVEEAAYGEAELKVGRRLARAGQVGAIGTHSGGYVATATEGEHLYRVIGRVEPLEPESRAVFAALVAGEAGWIGALVNGDLPRRLAEEAEELGVELVPWSGELGFECSCEPWADPCAHSIAVATQVGWLLDEDPLLLLALRGMSRAYLMAALHEPRNTTTGDAAETAQGVDLGVEEVDAPDDLAVAVAAARWAEQMLRELGA